MNKRTWLLEKRLENGFTQSEVATKAKIARTTYSMIENGHRDPSVEVAKAIAYVLKFEWTIFFENKCHETCSNTA